MKPEGRLITCKNCGESGRLAGGLRKIDEHYECNNRQRCEALLAEKQAILAEMQATVKVPQRYYCTACRKHHTKSSKVGKEHTSFYLKEA